jgi:hypothetical protein
MRVRVWVEQEVEVDVPIESLMDQLPGLEAPTRVEEIGKVASRCVGLLGKVPDDLIHELPSNHRTIIAGALRTQMDRYGQVDSEARSGGVKAESGTKAPKKPKLVEQRCRECGCTDDDCRQCVERTGEPCTWVESGLCSACAPCDFFADTPAVAAKASKKPRRKR